MRTESRGQSRHGETSYAVAAVGGGARVAQTGLVAVEVVRRSRFWRYFEGRPHRRSDTPDMRGDGGQSRRTVEL